MDRREIERENERILNDALPRPVTGQAEEESTPTPPLTQDDPASASKAGKAGGVAKGDPAGDANDVDRDGGNAASDTDPANGHGNDPNDIAKRDPTEDAGDILEVGSTTPADGNPAGDIAGIVPGYNRRVEHFYRETGILDAARNAAGAAIARGGNVLEDGAGEPDPAQIAQEAAAAGVDMSDPVQERAFGLGRSIARSPVTGSFANLALDRPFFPGVRGRFGTEGSVRPRGGGPGIVPRQVDPRYGPEPLRPRPPLKGGPTKKIGGKIIRSPADYSRVLRKALERIKNPELRRIVEREIRGGVETTPAKDPIFYKPGKPRSAMNRFRRIVKAAGGDPSKAKIRRAKSGTIRQVEFPNGTRIRIRTRKNNDETIVEIELPKFRPDHRERVVIKIKHNR